MLNRIRFIIVEKTKEIMPITDLKSNRLFILFVKPNSFKSVIIFLCSHFLLSSYSVARKTKEKNPNTYLKSNFFKVSVCFYLLSSWILSSCSGKKIGTQENGSMKKILQKIGFTVHLMAKPLINFISFKNKQEILP